MLLRWDVYIADIGIRESHLSSGACEVAFGLQAPDLHS